MNKRRLIWVIAVLLASGLALGQAERSVVEFAIGEGEGWRWPRESEGNEGLELVLVDVLDQIGLARIDALWNGARVASLGAEAGIPAHFFIPGSGRWFTLQIEDLGDRKAEGRLWVPASGAPARQKSQVWKIQDVDVPPQLLRQSSPGYTSEALQAKIQGTVLLQFTVHEDGSLSDFEVLRSLGHGLDENAIEAISKEWVFAPARKDGRPVPVRATIEVTFTYR